MPAESAEYDAFDYKHSDETPLSLEDAARIAAQRRTADSSQFHRIVQTDTAMTGFRVESVPSARVYADMLSRWTMILHRFAFRPTKR
jgi:hypothetical protein